MKICEGNLRSSFSRATLYPSLHHYGVVFRQERRAR